MKTQAVNPEIDLKQRVLKVQAATPKGWDYTTLYQFEYGKQSPEELARIRNVWGLRITDEEITLRLEAIADKIKNS